MSDNRYIGVFDSGIGGLTVVKSIVECMPGENIIYFGDTAHVPYGTRSKRQITEYVLADVRFLRTFDIKAVVIACNTADSVAKEKVREVNPDLPVFGVVDPASRLAAVQTKNGRIGVIATNATVKTGAYERAIAK
ncbi:MAG: glutamate racemase, partial [Acutalibacteraceae bacterium]|nr:glutamate racemase [Acutalibacteraceae bacterium]